MAEIKFGDWHAQGHRSACIKFKLASSNLRILKNSPNFQIKTSPKFPAIIIVYKGLSYSEKFTNMADIWRLMLTDDT